MAFKVFFEPFFNSILQKTEAHVCLKPPAPPEKGFMQVWRYQHHRRRVSYVLEGFSTSGGKFKTSFEASAPAEEGFIYLFRHQHQVRKVSETNGAISTRCGRFHFSLEASAPSAQGFLQEKRQQHPVRRLLRIRKSFSSLNFKTTVCF